MKNNLRYIYGKNGGRFTVVTGGEADCDDCPICKLFAKKERVTLEEYEEAMKECAQQAGILGGSGF